MKILIITQFYEPEPQATSFRMPSFARALARKGHYVTIICEFPNHPTGVLAKGDKWRLFKKEESDRLKIIRTFVIPFKNKSFIKRLIFYSSFAVSSFIAGMLVKRHDIILSVTPPNFSVYSAMLLSLLKRSGFALDVHDMLTEEARELGFVKNRYLLKITGFMDKLTYKRASLIFTVSDGLKEIICEKFGPGNTHVIYNGSDEEMTNWQGDIQTIRSSMGWDDKIIVAYTGNIGLAQDIARIIAEISYVADDRLHFVFIGDGPCRKEVVETSRRMKINNITFIGQLSRSEVIPLTHASDIVLITLKEIDFFKTAIPTKFFDGMAAGKPVVTNVDGEVRMIIDKYKSGLYFTTSDKGSFARVIGKLAQDANLRKTMGENGKTAIKERFLRKDLSRKVVDLLEGMN